MGEPPRQGLLQSVLHVIIRVREQSEDLAEICLAGLRESKSILFGSGQGFFVGIDIPFAEPLQSNSGHEAATRVIASTVAEDLMVNIEGGLRILRQHAFLLPISQEASSPRIPIVVSAVSPGSSRFRIRRMTLAGCFLYRASCKFRIDDVVRWGDDIAEITDVAEVIRKGTKSLDFRHRRGASRVLLGELPGGPLESVSGRNISGN